MATYNKDFNEAYTFEFGRMSPSPQKKVSQDTRIIDLTVEQLTDIITGVVNKTLEAKRGNQQQDEWAYGLSGLAETLGCSVSQAQKIKATGKYNAAIKQVGRKIAINVTQLRQMLPNS